MNTPKKSRRNFMRYSILVFFGICCALLIIGALVIGYALIIARQNLPSVTSLLDYRPKIPLRIYSADQVLIGEFGEERRNLTKIKDIPEIMQQAVLAIEDARFYEHKGIDYIGIARALLAHIKGSSYQGASTITMQVARNFFLRSEKTFIRKMYEVLLSYKIETLLTKAQILELYMNQIYLGQRAYGFAAAAQIYFAKPLNKLSLAETAMLAGLPKAPSAYNPVNNLRRATVRQKYILRRMLDLNYISETQYEAAIVEKLSIRNANNGFATHADYVAEMARQLLYSQYKDEIYTRGFKVTTTILVKDQEAAYRSVRQSIIDYEKRHDYLGPEAFLDKDFDSSQYQVKIDELFVKYPDSDDLKAALVTQVTNNEVTAILSDETVVRISGEGLRFAARSLLAGTPEKLKIRNGALIRVIKSRATGSWEIVQMPEVSAAFIALDPDSGAIRALVGGFDFYRKQFNCVTQAWRQPGSSFKPFIYSAALDKGFWPGTIINDTPLSIGAQVTGSKIWEPKNYKGKTDGPITMRRALAKSKNLVTVRIMQAITPEYVSWYIKRFGFMPEKNPVYLSMALGVGATTPLQMAQAYAIFANGGYDTAAYLIQKIEDIHGTVLSQIKTESKIASKIRVLDARNVFIMDSLLKEVATTGSASAVKQLGRSDIGGKTGTTNNSADIWFAGYTPKLVGVAWMGYDDQRSLGERETGSGGALSMWINYMRSSLRNVPQTERITPFGVAHFKRNDTNIDNNDISGKYSNNINNGDWIYFPREKEDRPLIFNLEVDDTADITEDTIDNSE